MLSGGLVIQRRAKDRLWGGLLAGNLIVTDRMVTVTLMMIKTKLGVGWGGQLLSHCHMDLD